MIQVRRLSQQDWKTLRDVRLAALADAPYAFWATFQEESRFEQDQWRRFLGAAVWWTASRNDQVVGVVAVLRRGETRDEAELIAMWVAPDERRRGTAARMLQTACDWARAAGTQTLTLWVTEGNDRARRLYESWGFQPTGERADVPHTAATAEERMQLRLSDPIRTTESEHTAMASYANATRDPGCNSQGRIVCIGNVSLHSFTETGELFLAEPATAVLSIDVIAAPGYESNDFHFVTLILQIDVPNGALFVDHSGRNNYHREVLADAEADAFLEPDPRTVYWIENVTPSAKLRIRDDWAELLSGPGNGRTYYEGVDGLADGEGLQFTAFASASETRLASCTLTIADLYQGQALPGYLD